MVENTVAVYIAMLIGRLFEQIVPEFKKMMVNCLRERINNFLLTECEVCTENIGPRYEAR